jgi:hypothetical protein
MYSILKEFGVPTKLVSLARLCSNEMYSKVHIGKYLIVGFCILLRVYPLMLFLKTTICNSVFCARFYCALLTTCFGPDRWPSSGNTYIKYTKATTVYVSGSVEIAA